MKKLIATVLSVALSGALLTPAAFAWESHPVDMDKVGVDVGASDWAVEELKAAGEAGLVPTLTGNPGFQDAITREQFAELAVNLAEKATGAEITAVPADTFTDCSETAVLKAYAAGIVNGIGDGTFTPEQTTNREQIAAMLYRAVQYIEQNGGKSLAVKTTDISKYTDNAQVSSWAKDGVGVLAANGVMKGTSDTTLSPKASCTVEQSVILVYRLYEHIK